MRIGVPKESLSTETRVALTPETISKLVSSGHTVTVQKSAGNGSGFSDSDYQNAGSELDNSVTVITKDHNQEIKQIIYFDFDKSFLTDVNLKEIKNFLDTNSSQIQEYLIVGHADTKGAKKYNLKLSLERALSIQNILIKYGIDKNNTKIVGKGENELAIKTDDEIAHPANRRAEILPLN